jgi:Glyoxalase/Bleomycin resistance protein/Dioxygenase superfamily
MEKTAMPTASQATLLTVTPLVPAGPKLADALRFYTEQLGFAITWQGGEMAGVRRGGVEFNLVQNSNPVWADNASASIGVDDLDTLYSEYRTAPAQVGPLEAKSWGRREFHMILPSGVCLQFYQVEA